MTNHSSILDTGNAMDRGVWQATIPGVAKSQTQLNAEHIGFSGVMKMEVR